MLEQPHLFPSYTPQFRYFKITENEYSRAQLLKISNLVSTLFLAETQYDLELLSSELSNLFDREADKEGISFGLLKLADKLWDAQSLQDFWEGGEG